jgi:DNA processing protein
MLLRKKQLAQYSTVSPRFKVAAARSASENIGNGPHEMLPERQNSEMKALDLRRSDAQRRTPPRQHQPRGEPYTPPASELVHILALDALIAGIRSIAPEQQTRFHSDSRLWCVGNTSLLRQRCVAIVGTRQVSPEGAARSRRLARELATAGIVIVSGLAKGVDTEALNAAIEAGGKVVAVIGTPIDKAYPAENKHLQERIYREHLLISQFAPGERVFPTNFPERNKLMAAVSDATAITEAGDTSGTLHQAAECVRLGRWLFICKNVIENPSLTWPEKFRDYPNTRTLSMTDDVLRVLGV